MTTNTDTTTETQVASASDDDALRRFTLLALGCLGFTVTNESADVFVIQAREDQAQMFNGARSIRFVFGEEDASKTGKFEVVARGSRMFEWLCDRLQESGNVIQSAPHGQVTNVHNVTSSLFGAYDVDNGNVQLAGCQLQDRPVLQFAFREAGKGSSPALSVVNMLEDGTEITEDVASGLGLLDLVSIGGKPKKLSDDRVTEWRELAVALDARGVGERELAAINVVWCKYACGKIAFTVGTHRVEQAFEGWAQLFASKSLLPPPYECPKSETASYHLALTDDGILTCHESIEVCAVSKNRVLGASLETCAVTGERATSENMVACPVSDTRVLSTVAKPCDTCQQVVSPSALERSRCKLCRHLAPIDKDDPLMARVLGEWPKLDGWRNWSIGESKDTYVLVAAGLLKRLLVVASKDPLDVRRLATGTRFSKTWTDVDSATREDWLS